MEEIKCNAVDECEEAKQEFMRLFNQFILSRPGADKLLEWLNKSDFFMAPASSRFHLCVPGGLVIHSLNVYHRLLNLVEHEAANGFCPSGETVAVAALLHDLCKVNLYKKIRKSRKTGEYYPNGKPVWEDYDSYECEDNLPYGHGEKSVYITSGFIRLTREEAMAIRWHMGPWRDDDKRELGKAFELYKLALLPHIADMEATYLDEAEETPLS